MARYGLVLAGGGGKGAYQIGAWKALRELGVSFNAIAGTSIGSINGALIAQGDFDKALEMWQNVTIDKGVKITEALPDPENLFSKKNWGILFKEVLKNGGIDASPTKEFLAKYIDEKKIRDSKILLGIITVQLSQKASPLELFIDDIPEGELIDYLLASSNIPLVTNIGPEGEKFIDGGVYDNTPVMTLKKQGYNKLIIIDIANLKGVAHNLNFRNSQIVYIRPYNIDDLGASFDFDDETNKKRMTMGYYDAKKAFGELSGEIYYFLPDVFKKMVWKYGADEINQLEKLAYKLKLSTLELYTEDTFITSVRQAYEEEKAALKEKQEADEKAKQADEKRENEKDKNDDLGIFNLLPLKMRINTKRELFEGFEKAIEVLETERF